ncbi:hypothetical protein J2Y69_002160 [Microbacterium resistens]|uniref:Transposase n=1 Tax=Microbacterium resistens TaxID=156977 RepID=A0ABU1SD72_9MICO|nr:hypothetical protein [Microbacterium resistens]MDR6867556.1 hypothetical protein [Microbacterium resistens]
MLPFKGQGGTDGNHRILTATINLITAIILWQTAKQNRKRG